MAQLHTDRSDSSSQRPWTTYAHYLSIHKQDLCKHILSPHAGTHSCQMDLPLSLSAPPDFGAAAFFFFSLSPHYLVSAEKSPRAIYLPHRLSPCIHPDLCTACFFTPSTAVFRLAAPRTVSNYITIYRCVFLFFVVVVAAFTPSAEQITNGNFGSSRELHQYHLASVGTLYHEHVKNKLLLANGVTCCCCRRRSGWHYSGPRPFPSSRLPGAHHCWEGSGHFGQIAALRGEVKSVSLSFQHISGGNEQSTDGLGFRGTDGSSTRCSLSNLFMLTRL